MKNEKMGLKVVYTVISTEVDLYFEQVWASVWSLRHFNPKVYVMVLMDEATNAEMGKSYRSNALSLIDEIKVVKIEEKYSNKEKSRWLKTNLRNLIKGDFLFIDADTIITGCLTNVSDNFNGYLGAVLDHHCHSSKISGTAIFKDMYTNRLKSIYGMNYLDSTDIFNSGVLYVKDVPEAYRFFDRWHENWCYSCKKGVCVDQLPLAKTCQELGNPITPISGVYNCQIRLSVEFLYDALIVHTFASQQVSSLSPMFGMEIYQEIKKNGGIMKNVQCVLLNCKRGFSSPSFLVEENWLGIRFTPTYLLLEKLYKKKKYNKIYVMDFISRVLNKFF